VLYFDTSFLVPLILTEPTSAKVAELVQGLPQDQLAASQWTRVEFASMLGREFRMGNLVDREARQADADFETMLQRSFAVLLPNADDFNLAKQFLGRFETGLRNGDALHLAVAKNHGATAIYSLDKGLLKAGRTLGLPLNEGIETARRSRPRSPRPSRP
jgi:predicted nucleic acid-binding protein